MINKILIIFIIITTNYLLLFSNEMNDTMINSINYSITFGVGLSSDLDSITKHTDRSGIAFNFRFLIESYTNLSLGFEASYINISNFKQKKVQTNFGMTDIDNSLSAIPILFVAQHKIYFLKIVGGYGPAYVISEINSFGETSQSSEWDYSLLVGITYSHNFWNNFSINIEGKYFTIPSLFKNIVNGQLTFTYKIK